MVKYYIIWDKELEVMLLHIIIRLFQMVMYLFIIFIHFCCCCLFIYLVIAPFLLIELNKFIHLFFLFI